LANFIQNQGMKKYQLLFLFIFGLSFSVTTQAQHKIIWEMSSGDTAQQRVLYNQVNNVLAVEPDTKIEVVFHSHAVYAMLKDTGYFKTQINALYKQGVVFAVCNNSLKRRNIDKSRVIPEAVIVPVAILEIAQKQEEGRAYIKAGY
jgi:intracellular sulfur oxidation DsrE/DsrF family protein